MACRLIGAKQLSEPSWNIVNPWRKRQSNIYRHAYIFIQRNAFWNVMWKTAAISRRSHCGITTSVLWEKLVGIFHWMAFFMWHKSNTWPPNLPPLDVWITIFLSDFRQLEHSTQCFVTSNFIDLIISPPQFNSFRTIAHFQTILISSCYIDVQFYLKSLHHSKKEWLLCVVKMQAIGNKELRFFFFSFMVTC